jgi:hypothetical protein
VFDSSQNSSDPFDDYRWMNHVRNMVFHLKFLRVAGKFNCDWLNKKIQDIFEKEFDQNNIFKGLQIHFKGIKKMNFRYTR